MQDLEVKQWIITGSQLVANGILANDVYLKITDYLLHEGRQSLTFIIEVSNSFKTIKAPKGCPFSDVSQAISWATQKILMQLEPEFNFQNCPMPTIQLSPSGLVLYFQKQNQADCLIPYLDYHLLSPEQIEANNITIGGFGPFPTKIIIKEFKNIQSFIENLCQFDQTYIRELYLRNDCGSLYFYHKGILEKITKELLDYISSVDNQDKYNVVKKLCEAGWSQVLFTKVDFNFKIPIDSNPSDCTSFSKNEIALLNAIVREVKLEDFQKSCINFIVSERNAPVIIDCISDILNTNAGSFLHSEDRVNKIINILLNNPSPRNALSLLKELFTTTSLGFFDTKHELNLIKNENSLTQEFYFALYKAVFQNDMTDLKIFYDRILQNNNKEEVSFKLG